MTYQIENHGVGQFELDSFEKNYIFQGVGGFNPLIGNQAAVKKSTSITCLRKAPGKRISPFVEGVPSEHFVNFFAFSDQKPKGQDFNRGWGVRGV